MGNQNQSWIPWVLMGIVYFNMRNRIDTVEKKAAKETSRLNLAHEWLLDLSEEEEEEEEE